VLVTAFNYGVHHLDLIFNFTRGKEISLRTLFLHKQLNLAMASACKIAALQDDDDFVNAGGELSWCLTGAPKENSVVRQLTLS